VEKRGARCVQKKEGRISGTATDPLFGLGNCSAQNWLIVIESARVLIYRDFIIEWVAV